MNILGRGLINAISEDDDEDYSIPVKDHCELSFDSSNILGPNIGEELDSKPHRSENGGVISEHHDPFSANELLTEKDKDDIVSKKHIPQNNGIITNHQEFFKVHNALSELETEEDKKKARENLGITSNSSANWGKISGNILELTDLMQIVLENLDLVVSDTEPNNKKVLWVDPTNSGEVNNLGQLSIIQRNISILQQQLALLLKIVNYGIIAGDSTVSARKTIEFSATPINPNTNEVEEEKPDTSPLNYTVPNISIKMDTLENFRNNRNNLINGELMWASDKNTLYLYIDGKFKSISNNSIDINTDDDMTQEDIEKLYFTEVGLQDSDNNLYKVSINNDGQIAIYNAKRDYENATTPSKDNNGSCVSPYLRINSVFLGGEDTRLDKVVAATHNFVELANAGERDINLNGLYLYYFKTPGNPESYIALRGTIKAGSTFLIRGARCGYVSNRTVNVDDYDLEWYKDRELIRFNSEKGTFYLAATDANGYLGDGNGNNVLYDSLNTTKLYDGSDENKVMGYIDLVGIQSGNNNDSVISENGVIRTNTGEGLEKCIFLRSFTLDPCSQAQKTHSKKSGSSLWTYINMETISTDDKPYFSEYHKLKLTPKASKYNKNIFGTRTTFSESEPNMVNITFGRLATVSGVTKATRCFNWISVGYYDEYIEYRKDNGDWQKIYSITENTKDPNIQKYIKVYNRIRWITTNGTSVTTHKVILKNLDVGTYTYRVKRDNSTYCSPDYQFIVKADTDIIKFVQTTDQQAFNFNEYQAWVKSAYAIKQEHSDTDFFINTGDITQNGNRESEWLDYWDGKMLLGNPVEMYTIGNNDLCGIIPYELGNGKASKYKINHKNIQYYYTFELDPGNSPYFYFKNEGLDTSKLGDIIEGDEHGFTYYMPSLYSFNYGNWHFISINSEFADNTSTIYYNDSSMVSSIKEHAYYNMYKWIEKDINANSNKKLIAYAHEIPFCIVVADSATGKANDRTSTNGSKLNNSFANGIKYTDTTEVEDNYVNGGCFSELFLNNNVKLVLGGHKHTYSLSYPTKEKIQTIGGKRTVDFANPEINNGGVIYAMCQATGYKLVSNKELPGSGILWLNTYYPVNIKNNKAVANVGLFYPMYSVINTNENGLNFSSYKVLDVYIHSGDSYKAFDINNQKPYAHSQLVQLADDTTNISITYGNS